MLPESFHWIIEGKLAGAEKPTVKDLHMYREMGFTSIVCLQEWIKKKPLSEMLADYDLPNYTLQDIHNAGLEFLHLPVEDMKPPSYIQMDEFIDYVNNPERVVLVHCYGGIGRTGCMVAAYLGVRNNLPGVLALGVIHKIWKNYIQTYGQENAVIDYINSKVTSK